MVYDLSQPDGQRVHHVQVICTKCLVPHFDVLDPDKKYKVILPAFLVAGGDGYNVFPEHITLHQIYGKLKLQYNDHAVR